MNSKITSPVCVVLLNRLNQAVIDFTKPYNEVGDVGVILLNDKTYVYQHQTNFSNKLLYKEVNVVLDLNEVKGTVELKADPVRDPRALDYMLFLLQHNEISLGKAKEIVEHWCAGHDPISSDLPVVSMDNPLVSENDAPMDVLREVREDIIKRREADVQHAGFLAAFVDRYKTSLNHKWVEGLNDIVDHLTVDAYGKPVPDTLKTRWSFKVGDPRLPKFAIAQEGSTEFFHFVVKDDGTLSPEMKAAGATMEDVPGLGRVAKMPIQGMMAGSIVGDKVTGIPQQFLDEIAESMNLAMRQFSENVREALKKFRNPG